MFLLVAPTSKELNAFTERLSKDFDYSSLVCGVGILESSLTLNNYLSASTSDIDGVLLAGIAGAYSKSEAELLDICLASKEVLGDLGICYPDRIDPLDDTFAPITEFAADKDLLMKTGRILSESGINFHQGSFVTVSSVSGTKVRGDHLQEKSQAICENMEGAAIARICENFNIPWVEIRSISNIVIDRADQQWEIDGALSRCSEVIKTLMERLCG